MIQEKEILQLENLLALIYDLQQEPWPHQDLSRKDALDKIIELAQVLGVNIDPNDPDFLPLMTIKIVEISSQPANQEAPSLPPNLNELVKIYEKDEEKKVVELQKKITSQENYKRYQKFNDEFKKIILKTDSKIPLPLAEKMAQNAADKAISSLPPVAQADFFTEEIKNQVLKEAEQIINEEFEKIKEEGVLKEAEQIIEKEFQRIKEETTKGRVENLITEAQEIAANPTIIRPFQELIKTTPSNLETTLPQTVLDKLSQNPDEVTFLPIYTVLYPKAAAALIERGIYTLPANLLKVAAEEATPEWQAMIRQGVFYEDFQASIKYLKEIGVPEKHPLLLKLSDKAARFKEQQKIEYKDKKGNVFYKDKPAVAILKHYYHFSKATGRQKIYDDDLKANLPRLSPNTDWAGGGYAGFLKGNFNRLRSLVNIYERFSKFITKGKYNSFLTPARQFLSKKIAQPAIKWLAKTAAGKVIKAGAKKVAVWAATRLGIELGATIAGTAAGGVPGVVIAVASIALEAVKFIGGKIINFIKQVINDPEKALMAVGIGIIALVFIPNPLNLFGIIPIVFGGLGLVSFIMAPIALTAAGAGIGGFFIALGATPVVFPIALFLIIFLSTMAVLTLFIVLVVSGSFILPAKMTETDKNTISAYESPYFILEKTANPQTIQNLQNNESKEISYKVTITAKDKSLSIISINEEISLSSIGNPSKPQPYSFDEELKEKGKEISPGETWEAEYSINVNSSYNDTAIINTVKAWFAVNDEEAAGNFPGVTSASVIIGNPPGDCPDTVRWPTCGGLTQGPMGSYSHGPHGEEAIDIHNSDGTAIYATHNGDASMNEENPNGFGAGYYVTIKGICQGTSFTTKYFHMRKEGRASGPIVKGQIIGYMSNSGTQGVHLHYEFRTGDGARRWSYGGSKGIYPDNKIVPTFPPLMAMLPPYTPKSPTISRSLVIQNIKNENGGTTIPIIQPTFGKCTIGNIVSY